MVPSTTSGTASSARRNGTLVVSPATAVPASAASRRSSASVRVGAQAMTLASIGS